MDLSLPLSPDLSASLMWVGVWLCISSGVTYLLFGMDRRRAARAAQRLPEGNLLWLSTFGGWPGALLALRRAPEVRFSPTFRGWLRAIIAAELLFLGMATLPHGALIPVAEGLASVVFGKVTAAERELRPGRVVLDSTRGGAGFGQVGVSNIVTLSTRP